MKRNEPFLSPKLSTHCHCPALIEFVKISCELINQFVSVKEFFLSSNRHSSLPMDYVKLAGAGIVTVGAATAYYLLQGPETPELGVDLHRQTSHINTTEGTRISRLCENNKLLDQYHDDVSTVYEGFQRGLRIAGDRPCLGYKPDPASPYKWITYKQVNERVCNFGSGLVRLGFKAENSTRIGIYSQNRPEYVISDQAMGRHSMTGVPLYDTLGVNACTFIINQAELSVILCDNNDKVKKLLDRRKEYPQLNMLILCEPISEESKALAQANDIKIITFADVEEMGKKNPVDPTPASPDDLYIICYTSGTTGNPKGAMLTHKNVIASVAGSLKQLDACSVGLTQEDLIISYLPLAHSYERIIEVAIQTVGASIGFFQGDVRKLMDDIKELRPTVFPSVPRLLNRLYDKVSSGANGSRIKKILFSWAISSKTKELKRGIIRNNSIWDRVVFSKVQDALGGRCRAITTGSAPLSGEVLSFLRCIVGCPIIEGYGQTESSAVSTMTVVGDSDAGHVGPPIPCNMIKLEDVPEMEYFSNNNKGEVCIKGSNVFKGYLNDEEKTREAVDKDGWLHTGDIGEWLPSGALKIIDRKKNIFKLAQGEYIAPEKIENVLIQSPYLAQVYVHGNSLESYLVGVVVPDPDVLPNLVAKLGATGTLKELATNPVVKQAIMDDLKELSKKNGLSSLEQMKDFLISPEMFSVENGLLTPTFKTKRNVIAAHFDKDITEMYTRTNAALSAKSKS